MKQEYIRVGRIVNAHGIRGEVRVQPRRVSPALLTRCRTFYIDGQPVTPTANHVHKELVLMKFPGVEDMNAALVYKGKELYIRRSDVVLPEGEYFDDELIGLTVRDCDTGALLGDPSGPNHKTMQHQDFSLETIPICFLWYPGFMP